MKKLLALLLFLTSAAPASAENVYFTPPVIPTATTVAGLPVCNAAAIGWTFIVTNSLLPALGVAVAGGGAVSVLVKCNGTLWLVGQ